ncbi:MULTISPECIES: acyl-CoA-binding protein [unclassified Thiomonas]|jgi:acyl-CoA-binding protein|uniref:acyl-CoA-binding protein n=1 Tax=unclassified Thiomonas TaxID=2625466 RepID=UPI0004DBB58F|nr:MULTISPECIES: acyl-CoA-binding protein [unclassified Thiomonas]MDD5002088.1 acyl-CoA-binding protein [Thiomonas arsenitoxydans]CQR44025.1 Acyl-CoA-binding protein [Thiomonas sp. CB3]CDW96383.1 Acyl-CoA-binding protein [Thiomonas sp. CB2]VDY06020.1 Acyl-CoA-binding protein (ACBP) (Diazepam-binding inhibitor) (DBI) (Endozepine) (EP) [Thiomonas sp. Bio17B3]VDY10683.1 Acyl-CoA-binding protein (ACBP) (Diazepam-binding inhibitor) (DBI) (Endozepine) (EP) [Thiomonas sp. Sup16B3]
MTDTTLSAELQTAFGAAVAHSKTLTTRPDNQTLLQLYGLYKQGSAGDVSGERPSLTDFVTRAKWDAWAARKGMPRAEAMQAYIDQINALST